MKKQIVPVLFLSCMMISAISSADTGAEALALDLFNKIRAGDLEFSSVKDLPLREQNLSDVEVRQIEMVMNAYFPGAIVSIGGVTEGCNCAESPACSSQVAVTAYRPDRSAQFVLSRLNHRWGVGRLQAWWLEYEALFSSSRQERSGVNSRLIDLSREERIQALHNTMPVCD